MHPRALLWVLVLLLLVPSPGMASSPAFEPSVHFDHLGRKQGLSHYSVLDVLQDHRGFMWFATQAGLDRFDGHGFRSYRHVPGEPGSLSYNRISSLFEDRDGDLWIGTDGGGVSRMLHEQGIFETFLPSAEEGLGGGANRVNAIAQDGDGQIWLASFRGVFRLDPRDGKFVHYPAVPGGLTSEDAFALLVDGTGKVWIGTSAGLERLDPETGEVATKSLGATYCIAADPGGGFWVGTTDRGLLHVDPETDIEGDGFGTIRQVLPKHRIRDIFVGAKGILWLGTASGLTRFSVDTGVTLDFEPDPTDAASLSHENVTSVFEDDSGVVWAATWGGGVNHFDGRTLGIRRARHRPGLAGSLSHDEAMAILEDRSGALWVGTWRGGLNRLDAGATEFEAYRADPDTSGTLASDAVTALFEDRAGRLWVGARGGGIHRFDATTGLFEIFPLAPDPLARIHMIHAITEDESGRLWLGTSGGGLVRFEPGDGSFDVFAEDPGGTRNLGDDDAWALLPDGQVLWVGTSTGLRVVNLETETIESYRADPEDPSSLPHDRINCLFRDRRGQIWVGTDGGGVALVIGSGSDRSFRRLGEEDGLPSALAKAIVQDDRGFLWIATDRGISRLDPETFSLRNLGARGGAQQRGYFEKSAISARDGNLYFGGLDGLTVLDPNAMPDPASAPRVVLTGFLLSNRRVAVATAARPTPLDRPIDLVDEIELDHDLFPLAFEFAALQYSSPDQHRFLYRLEGLDEEWIPADARNRRATYSKLAPGQYSFRVRGANSDGVWSERDARLQILVRSPWWMTLWARSGGLAFLVALLFATIWTRLRRSERARDLLESRVAERTAELAKLTELTERINQAITMEEVLDCAYDSLASIVPFDRLGLALLDEHCTELRSVWSKGARELSGIGEGYVAAFRGSSLERVLETGSPRVIPDLEAHLAAHPESTSTRRIVDEGIRSNLTCPLEALGRPLGFVFFSSYETHTYTERHVEFLRQIAGPLSLSIGKTRLYEDLLSTKSKLEIANRELETLAASDGLTGLANHRTLAERLSAEWIRSARVGAPLSFLMIDVDFFKAYNDLYGHTAGDDCLRAIAGVLSGRVQRVGDLVARYGGEEFSVLLDGCPAEAAVEIAEELREAVGRLELEHEGSPVHRVVTVSIGCATLVASMGGHARDLVTAADGALYEAKHKGRNRVEQFVASRRSP